MTGKKARRLMEFMVPEDVRDTILQVSVEKDLTVNGALYLIVREWRGNKEIEPLNNTPKMSGLGRAVDFLENIEQHCEVGTCNDKERIRRRYRRG